MPICPQSFLGRRAKTAADDGTAINQIAEMVGFSAPPGLTNFFQKHTPLTPSDFRQHDPEDSTLNQPAARPVDGESLNEHPKVL